tara:strand:+ start:563 stop:1141 length:579 start_codon:yes stop_codon:yes gene_type:complete
MSEQNETPIAENNSVTNDSTKAATNDNMVPQHRLGEVSAQRNQLRDENAELLSKLQKYEQAQEQQRKADLEKQGEYKTLLEEQGRELEKYKADSNAWNEYKTNKRASIMETITNDDDKLIAEDLSLAKLEKFAKRVTQTNTVNTPNQRPANSKKGTGAYGGYSSYQEWATKDPEGYQEANTVKGQGIKIAYE